MDSIVSVIIPTFNRSGVIGDAINSVINQTYQNIELIVVDDGSTDDTEEICKNYPEINYYRQKNKGASSARNYGIGISNGEFIAFLDSDDVWRTDKIEKQINFFINNPDVSLVLSDVTVRSMGGELHFTRRTPRFNKEIISLYDVAKFPYFSTSTVIVKSSVMKEVGLFDVSLKTAEDLDLFLRVAEKHTIGYMNEPFVSYLISDNNLSGSKDSYLDKEKVYKEFFVRNKKLITKYPNLSRSIFYKLNMQLARYLIVNGSRFLAFKRLCRAATYHLNGELFILMLKILIPTAFKNYLKKGRD